MDKFRKHNAEQKARRRRIHTIDSNSIEFKTRKNQAT